MNETAGDRLEQQVQTANSQMQQPYRADTGGLFSGISHRLGSLTEWMATKLHEITPNADVRTTRRAAPPILGGIAGLVTGYIAMGLTSRTFRSIPWLGKLLSAAGGALAGFTVYQLLRPVEPRSVAEYLPTGVGTVPPLPREQVLRDTIVPVPQNAPSGEPLPPVDRPVPVVLTENIRPPAVSWERIMELRVQADSQANAVGIGVGTVRADSLESLFNNPSLQLHRTREGVANLTLSYQRWQETVRMLGSYTQDYRTQVVPQIRQQLATLGFSEAEADATIPQFPAPPTLYGSGKEWEGINDVSSSMNRYGQRAVTWMLQNHPAQCTGMTKAEDWNKLNVSEKINFLDNYCARLDTTIHTGPDGKRTSKVDLGVMWVIGGWAERFRTASHEFARKKTAGPNGTDTRTAQDYENLANIMQEGLDAGHFNRDRVPTVQLMVEYYRSKRVLEEMRRYDRDVHQPNRLAMISYCAAGGPLDRYNQSVRLFREQMMELEESRCLVTTPSVTLSNQLEVTRNGQASVGQCDSFRAVEVRDCRKTPNRMVQFYVERRGDTQVVRAMRVRDGANYGEWQALSTDIAIVANREAASFANILNRIDAGEFTLSSRNARRAPEPAAPAPGKEFTALPSEEAERRAFITRYNLHSTLHHRLSDAASFTGGLHLEGGFLAGGNPIYTAHERFEDGSGRTIHYITDTVGPNARITGVRLDVVGNSSVVTLNTPVPAGMNDNSRHAAAEAVRAAIIQAEAQAPSTARYKGAPAGNFRTLPSQAQIQQAMEEAQASTHVTILATPALGIRGGSPQPSWKIRLQGGQVVELMGERVADGQNTDIVIRSAKIYAEDGTTVQRTVNLARSPRVLSLMHTPYLSPASGGHAPRLDDRREQWQAAALRVGMPAFLNSLRDVAQGALDQRVSLAPQSQAPERSPIDLAALASSMTSVNGAPTSSPATPVVASDEAARGATA